MDKIGYRNPSKSEVIGIVVKLCCVEGLMEARCTSNKHSR